MTDIVLEVDGLATGYGDLRVVWDVSLQVPRGSVVALLGRNGAGKTTTLRGIAGLNPLHAGRVLLEGADLGSAQPYTRVRRGLAYVQEGKRIISDLSVEKNLRLGAFTVRERRAAQQERLDRAYATFPVLADRRSTPAGLLSGGQQQMLAIAQALMPDPTVLMVDEPSAGLAPAIVGDVLEMLRELSAGGLTVLLVEQSIQFAVRVAERVAVLDQGRVAYVGDTGAPGAVESITQAYLSVAAAGAQS